MVRRAIAVLVCLVGPSCADPETPVASDATDGSDSTASTASTGDHADDTDTDTDTDSASDSASDSDSDSASGTGTGTGTAGGGSRCEVGESSIVCEHETVTLLTGLTDLAPRQVHWQVPFGDPPPSGWPTVLLFQGSIFTAELFWAVIDADAFGMWNQGLLTKALLDEGFAVITPEAHAGGFTAWETNIPPMSLAWESSADHQFMLDIFAEMDAGTFGPLDPARLYAAGISSGGYMTSRMDEAYRARFAALAIASASYATCGGPACAIPALDPGHLPTLFLHGTDDLIVPIDTMWSYADALQALGVQTSTAIAPGVGHGWTDEAPTAIPNWFSAH